MELYLHSPNMPLWHGAQLRKAQRQLNLYLYQEKILKIPIRFKVWSQNGSKNIIHDNDKRMEYLP
jgi:hypothetical protein